MKRGITLLETLIAMLVMTVGLLGLASLLPVSRFFMADGSKYDHTATLGQEGLHKLETNGKLMIPSNWYAPDGLGGFTWVCPPAGNGGFPSMSSYNYLFYTQTAATTDIPAAPFILDPLGCAYPDNLKSNGAAATYQVGPTFFPPAAFSLDQVGGLQGSPGLSRVTIPRDNQASGVYRGDKFSPVANPAYAGDPTKQPPLFFRASPMAFAVAQSIFTSTDDPVFALPSDPSQRPTLPLPTSANPSQWSRTQGDYSWFVTVDNMQKPWNRGFGPGGTAGGWGDLGVDDNNDGIVDNAPEAGWPAASNDPDIALWQTSGGELWEVSVVVCYKRNLQLNPLSATDVPPERMCYCDFLTAPLPPPATFFDASGNIKAGIAGLGGGDCLLYIPTPLASGAAAPKEWLDVKPNQWVMISGFPNLASKFADPPIKSELCTVQWFRLASVGETEAVFDSSNNQIAWKRAVTLAGADLEPYKFFDAVGAPGGNQSLYCTIVDGVTGVFEATIEQGQSN